MRTTEEHDDSSGHTVCIEVALGKTDKFFMDKSEEQYRKLAERLLAAPSPYSASLASVRMLPGLLPDDQDLKLPLPPSGTVIGSLIRIGSGPPYIEVVLDVGGDEASILDFYQQELSQRGWHRATQLHPQGGFIPAGVGTDHRFFRTDESRGISIKVTPHDGINDVRLRTQWISGSPTWSTGRPAELMSAFSPPPGGRAAALVPAFSPPPGVSLWSDGGGGNDARWTAEAIAYTDKPAAELEAHFASQMREAAWERLGGDGGGPAAWSVWRLFAKGEWLVFLFVVEVPGKDRRALTVRIESGTRRPPGRAID